MADNDKIQAPGVPAANNPWNGLRTYVEGEVIYGRSEEIHVLSLLILQNSQTVVYGRSGIGKSSVLNAGIFPLVRRRGVFPVYVRFEHNVEASYLDQIRSAINREVAKSAGAIKARRLVEPSASESLWEFFHAVEYTDAEGNIVKPLVVLDQFEEIFTLENDKQKRARFFHELAGLINNVMPEDLYASGTKGTGGADGTSDIGGGMLDLGFDTLQDLSYGYKQESDFHIVFTLREDFLSYLERNTTDIPALKNTRYSLRPINEEQAAEIIMQPRPGLVDIDVARLIIEKVTREKDFELNGVPQIQVDSAILSLYLSRLYEKMVAEGAETITAQLVETHSDNIIEDFYSDAIRGLDPHTVEWLEDTLINEDGRRDNRDRSTVLRESGLSEEGLDRLVYDVKLLRQFSYGGDLRVEYIHDVLCPVITERRKKREEDRRIRLIEAKAREEKRKSRRRLLSVVSIFLLIALAAGAYWWWYSYQYVQEVSSYYASFRLEGGWPVGVGEKLSADQRRQMPLYYRLSHRGHASSVNTEVEVCSSNSMLPQSARLDWPELSDDDSDARGQAFNDILARVKTIRFEAGEDGKISRMELADDAGKQLLVMSYFHTGPQEAWIEYLAPNGQAFTFRNNDIDRTKVIWDEQGRVSSQSYFNSQGDILPLDKYSVTGFLWTYPEEGTTVKYYLNIYGLPNLEKPFNMVSVSQRGDTTETFYARAMALDGNGTVAAPGPLGFTRVVRHGRNEDLYVAGRPGRAAVSTEQTDARGNVLSQRIEGDTGLDFPPYITWKYKGDTGLETEKRYLTLDGRPYGSASDIYLWEKTYADDGTLTGEKRTATDGRMMYAYSLQNEEKGGVGITRREWIDNIKGRYLVQLDSVESRDAHHTRSAVAYYGRDGKPVNFPVEFGMDTVRSHRVVTTTEGPQTLSLYYAVTDEGRIAPVPTSIDPVSLRATAFSRRILKEGDAVKEMEIADADGNIVKRMTYFLRDGQTIARAVSSVVDGSPVRCPNWEEEGFGYYVLYYTKNFNDQYSAFQAYDEWRNPSGLLWDPDSRTYMAVSYRDFKNDVIESGDSKFNIPVHVRFPVAEESDGITDVAVPFLHILSKESVLHSDDSNRLLDGDRLMAVGNWRFGMPESLLASEWARLDNDDARMNIEVLRVEGAGLKPVAVSVEGRKGEARRSEYHVFNLSRQELDTFDRYAKK